MLISQQTRHLFPLLQGNLAYLDNAATTQKPQQVITAIQQYYEHCNANVHRAVYALSERSTKAYEDARAVVASFVNANPEEIIFTRNATEALNLLAYSLELTEDDEVILTKMEHHSNIVPWQQTKAKIKYVDLKDGELDIEHYKSLLNAKTKVVAVTHMSNVLGTINDVKTMAQLAHQYGALMVVDAAQSAAHLPIDVKELDCDFLAISAHKMFGPTGIGALYGRRELLEKMKPFQFGGDMIKSVTLEGATWNDVPHKFEAGTPNMAGAVGFATAITFINQLGKDALRAYEQELTRYAVEKLQSIPGITIYGPRQRGPVISFTLNSIHPHDISAVLDEYGVAIRGGHHCAMPLMKELGIAGTARISLSIYNTTEDIDRAVAALKKCIEVFA